VDFRLPPLTTVRLPALPPSRSTSRHYPAIRRQDARRARRSAKSRGTSVCWHRSQPTLAHPGGNATGFTMLEYGMSGKWLELLKQVSPHITRAAVLHDPALASGRGQLGAIQAVGPLLGVEVSSIDVRDPGEIERGITEFAGGSNGGLIVTSGRFAFRHRALIIMLSARHQLPTVYPYRSLVASGGLISSGPSSTDSFRRAAVYVDRILKGENPADLPVQAPTKYELAINLKTAKALSLDVPPTLLDRADEVIE
jgi:ABC-type uncharacterized transport system substrate-binding protein